MMTEFGDTFRRLNRQALPRSVSLAFAYSQSDINLTQITFQRKWFSSLFLRSLKARE